MKTWLITGTSDGLGRIMTERLLERGDHVIATVRRTGVLNELVAKYPETLRVAMLEMTDTQQIRSVVADAFTRHIDVVVSNAGYGLFGAAEELDDAQIDHQIATNLVGSMQLIRAVIPRFRAQKGGLFMQLSSAGGQVAFPSFSAYHATKWGIEGFVESVAQEVKPFGINFVIVEPGATVTSFGKNLVRPKRMDVYLNTPAHDTELAIADGRFAISGDPKKVVAAMIARADVKNPPLRLTLGSDSYNGLVATWKQRLADLEAQRETALGADLGAK